MHLGDATSNDLKRENETMCDYSSANSLLSTLFKFFTWENSFQSYTNMLTTAKDRFNRSAAPHSMPSRPTWFTDCWYLKAVVAMLSIASMIRNRAESVPTVMSVPQKSLSMEPTMPTMFRLQHCSAFSADTRSVHTTDHTHRTTADEDHQRAVWKWDLRKSHGATLARSMSSFQNSRFIPDWQICQNVARYDSDSKVL